VIGIFKQKNPANIILLLIFGVLIKLPMFLDPHVPVLSGGEGIIFREIMEFLAPAGKSSPVVYPLVAFGFLFLQSLMLTQFINAQRMMNRSNYFPGMAYLLITSLLPEWNFFSAPMIVNTLLLFILAALFRIYNQENAKGSIFNIGLALGVAGFVFAPSLVFLVWVLLALMVMRPFRINEWILCLLGITTPFYFYAIYLFITDQWDWAHLLPSFTIGFPAVRQSAWLAGSVFLLTIPFLLGGYYVQDSLRRMLIQVRKGWSLLLLYLLVAVCVPFVNNSDNFENWVMAAVPFAAFHAATYMYATFRVLPVLLFWLTVAFVVGYQYYGPGWS
jgi:hypothetical protein